MVCTIGSDSINFRCKSRHLELNLQSPTLDRVEVVFVEFKEMAGQNLKRTESRLKIAGLLNSAEKRRLVFG